ncbi:hypothetical protein HPB51_027323 [Rhipicephalus microplus]|uniref:Uncharacterized protein n=1 Tax=Rhipicephalus microplus TaxID=6941 RepID=A0A9J6D087_RHIMP|nr:hypothetical protein HPB51_027323 [Rhipicephalus microplus]
MPKFSFWINSFWTDAMIALHWVSGDAHQFETFVRNRVQEIQTFTRGYTWWNCASADNPADFLTRGISAAVPIQETKLWNGPPWLAEPEGIWPLNPRLALTMQDLNSELAAVCPTAVSAQDIHPPTLLRDLQKYSFFSRLL